MSIPDIELFAISNSYVTLNVDFFKLSFELLQEYEPLRFFVEYTLERGLK
jgi:hypothetical protein